MEAAAVLSQQPKIEAAAGDAVESSFLSFLNDELVFGSEALDAATLEAVCQVADNHGAATQAACGSAARPLTAAQHNSQVPGLATKRSLEDAGGSESDDDEESGRGEKASAKRSKGEMSAAATKKACREKARREKLNERFSDLARLIDPNGEPKTDKSTILTDAIKYVQQMTVENHQLRQLNKFLEERVAALERERGQQLYQQSLMMTSMGQGQLMQTGQAMLVGGSAGMMSAAVPGALSGAPMGHPLQASASMASSTGSLLPPQLPTAPTPPLPVLHSQPHQQHPQALRGGGMMAAPAQHGGGMVGMQMVPPGAAGGGVQPVQVPGVGVGVGALSAAGVAVNLGAGPGPSKPILVNSLPGGAGPVQYQPMYWLPPQMMDSTQDSLLRPPAA